jgi:hypothetical protein
MKVGTSSERGVAVVVALLAMTVISALGAALVLLTSTEAMIAGNFRHSRQAFYAAEAITELTLAELHDLANWMPVVEGSQRSVFVDGPPDGLRDLPTGAPVNLTEVFNLANCGVPTPCGGVPRWQLFAYGPVRNLLSAGSLESPFYIAALVGNPVQTADGALAVTIRGEAFGPRGAHQAVAVTLSRSVAGETHVLRLVVD